jgi:hypothetical protein
MFNLQLINPQKIVPNNAQRRFQLTPGLAQKIVKIAGIGAGDRVFYSGIADQTLEAMVMGTGARFVTGKAKPRPGRDRTRADIALGCIPRSVDQKIIAGLHLVRRRLRYGGRVVMWAALDHCHSVSTVRDRFLKLAGDTGFTSLIVGRLPGQKESKIVVATGILNR